MRRTEADMPFIRTTTNKELSQKEKVKLRELYGKLIEKIPGKSEEWLMISISDGTYMAFRGEDEEPCAMIEVDLLGAADSSALDEMTEAVCDKVGNLLDIDPARIYVRYQSFEHWGYNRFNF